ncbi:MAG TPA: transposase [Longimicrobium sp.]|nr:transposase [Longimicrobium sp.]
MRAPYTQLYLHAVWSTWDRLPLITPDIQPKVFAAIQAQSEKVAVDILTIGGVADHVHVLLRFPTTRTIADVIKSLKGGSTHLITQVMRLPDPFKWQGGYGAFTISKTGVPRVRDYILRQEEHHRFGRTLLDLEATATPE